MKNSCAVRRNGTLPAVAKASVTPWLQRKCDCGQHTAGGGECEECKNENMKLQRHGNGKGGSGIAPAIVHQVLQSPGKALDSESRSFFEPRFGHDFSRVRVHTDERAAESARAVNALAYTVGRDVVFGAGSYRPGSRAGRELLAHELAHTIQQDGGRGRSSGSLAISQDGDSLEQEAETTARAMLMGGAGGVLSPVSARVSRVPCLPAASCPAGAPGSAGATSSAADSAAAAARARRARMSPARARATGHAGPARQLEKVLDAEAPGLRAKIHGIFVDQDFPAGEADAFTQDCADFTPPITGATKPCVFVPAILNQQALAFNTGAGTIGGSSRDGWKVETVKTLVHEVQHIVFDTAGQAAPPGVTCARSTVDFELSEISARMSEFPIAFRAVPAGAAAGDPAVARLASTFDDILANPKGNIGGGLKAMRCKCACADVDAYVRQTFTFTSSSWSTGERTAFNTELKKPKWGLNWPI